VDIRELAGLYPLPVGLLSTLVHVHKYFFGHLLEVLDYCPLPNEEHPPIVLAEFNTIFNWYSQPSEFYLIPVEYILNEDAAEFI